MNLMLAARDREDAEKLSAVAVLFIQTLLM